MTVNSKMTALADEIRELSGTTIPKGIDAMTTDVSVANIEISEQTDLIMQISSALEGKASGVGTTETCTLTVESCLAEWTVRDPRDKYILYIDSSLQPVIGELPLNEGWAGNITVTYTVHKNSLVCVYLDCSDFSGNIQALDPTYDEQNENSLYSKLFWITGDAFISVG